MIEVELNKIQQNIVILKLHGTVSFTLEEKKYKELILASKASEGSDNYCLHYHGLICEISEQAANELIDLGAKVVQLEDLINFRISK